VGMFQDRTTLAIITFASPSDAARLTAKLNSYLTLAISYAGYQFYPVPLGYQLSFLKAPGSQQQLVTTLILCSLLLAILIAMYVTYLYRRKTSNFSLRDFLLRPLTEGERNNSNSNSNSNYNSSSDVVRGGGGAGGNGSGGDGVGKVIAGAAAVGGAAAGIASTSFPPHLHPDDVDEDDGDAFGNPSYSTGYGAGKKGTRASGGNGGGRYDEVEDEADVVGGVELDDDEYVDATGDLGLPPEEDDDYMYGDSAYLVQPK
jgi:hypothetical protein